MGTNLIVLVLLPVIFGLATLGVLYYVRGGDLSLIRLILWILWMTVLCGGLGFISVQIVSLPNRFLTVLLGAVLLGILYLALAPVTLDWWQRQRLPDVFLTNLILLFFGIAGYAALYSVLASRNDTHYMLVAMGAFLLPAGYRVSYDNWMRIPPKKYKTWLYPIHSSVPRLHPIDPVKVTMNFTPLPTGNKGPFEGYEVEFPTNVSVGELFHYFISFHNKHREYSKKPIQYLNGTLPLEWVLFTYSSPKKKVYLDMDKTLPENQVMPNEHIYAYSTE